MNTYKKRILDSVLERRFKSAGAILLEGIKWCGKTTTCEQLAKSAIYMDEPEKREHNILMARIRPSEVLDGESLRLVEVKLGGEQLIERGADTLKKLASRIDTAKMAKPSFMMVLTAVGECAYSRPDDGIVVCPIGCLRD